MRVVAPSENAMDNGQVRIAPLTRPYISFFSNSLLARKFTRIRYRELLSIAITHLADFDRGLKF